MYWQQTAKLHHRCDFFSHSHLKEKEMAGFDKDGMFEVSVEELGHAVLIKTFRMVGAKLGEFVMTVLKRVYGELQWRRKAGEALSRRTFEHLERTRRRGLKDMWLATELMLHNLEVFEQEANPSNEFEKEENIRLGRMAMDVDCVNQTRNYLFHGFDVSPEEALRCIWSLENTWRRFAHLVDNGSTVIDDLEIQQMVGFHIYVPQQRMDNHTNWTWKKRNGT